MSTSKINITKSIRSFAFAINGIKKAIVLENNFRIHLVVTAMVVAAAFYFGITHQEWLWLVLFIALVLVSEMINAAIEKLVDLVCPEINPTAGLVKDLAAGAVLVAALIAVTGGTIIFWKYFMNLIN